VGATVVVSGELALVGPTSQDDDPDSAQEESVSNEIVLSARERHFRILSRSE
jgi:hypothetical protein